MMDQKMQGESAVSRSFFPQLSVERHRQLACPRPALYHSVVLFRITTQHTVQRQGHAGKAPSKGMSKESGKRPHRQQKQCTQASHAPGSMVDKSRSPEWA